MGDKTYSFVQKSLEHCLQNPELASPFLDTHEFAVDLQGFKTIHSLYQPLLQICEALSDTMTLSGSEANSAALIFYNSIKYAMKSKIPKAGTIYNDLSASFPRGRKGNEEAEG